MTNIHGPLRKLKILENSPLHYYLRCGEEELFLNDFIGQVIQLSFTDEIYCIQCKRKTSKSFQQGYCFPCLKRLQECQLCLIHPEKCLVEHGKCPENDWAHAQCHAEHIVYLANASGLKIGITRIENAPTRWFDQGAQQAVALCKVSNRYQAGVVEVLAKKFVDDKTNWRKMLNVQVETIDLLAAFQLLQNQWQVLLPTVIEKFAIAPTWLDLQPKEFIYPIKQFPAKITSLSFDQTPVIAGKILGMKGQYLILETGVLNIRKFGGYVVDCKIT